MVEEPMTIRVDWFLDGTRNMAELKEWNVNLFWICFYTQLPKKPKYTSIYYGRFDKSGLRSLRAYSYIEILGYPFRALLQTWNTQNRLENLYIAWDISILALKCTWKVNSMNTILCIVYKRRAFILRGSLQSCSSFS